MTERSPWRIAFEALAHRPAASESVTLRINAKREVQPEVTAVAKDGESLVSVYARAAAVLRGARADFPSPDDPKKLTEPFNGSEVPEEEIPF